MPRLLLGEPRSFHCSRHLAQVTPASSSDAPSKVETARMGLRFMAEDLVDSLCSVGVGYSPSPREEKSGGV